MRIHEGAWVITESKLELIEVMRVCKGQQHHPLEQWSPTFLAPETNFVEDSFSMGQRWGGWVGDDSISLHLLSTLL